MIPEIPATHIPDERNTSLDTDQLAVQLFEHMQGLINFADTKAQLTLAADALLAATIAPLSKEVLGNIFKPGALVIEQITSVLGILMFVSLLASIYFSLRVARPVLHVSVKRPSLFYFGHIVKQGEEKFIQSFLNLSAKEVRESLLAQIFARSKIAQRKFVSIRYSLDFLVAALILWAVVQILLSLP
jgi:hypothetical protein